MISRGGAQWRRVRRGQRGTPTLFSLPQTFRWRDGAAYIYTKFQKYLIKYKLKCLQCFQLFVLAPGLCV